MSFPNFRQNLKGRKMPIIQIVIASFLFLIISDKGNFSSFSSFIQNFQVNSPEAFITGLFDFGRIVSLQYSIAFGIGYMFLGLAKAVAIAIALLAIIKFVFSFERVQEKKVEIVSAQDRFHTNDIYLQTSKFIC